MPLTQYQSLKGLLLKGLLLGSGALLAMGVLAPSTPGATSDKVLVCHRPPDNPSSFRILAVASSAVAEHLAHRDNLVAAEVCDGVDNDCDGVVDNNLGTCTVGIGACAGTAPLICIDGMSVCTAVESPDCVCPRECSVLTDAVLNDLAITSVECGFDAARNAGELVAHGTIRFFPGVTGSIGIAEGRCQAVVAGTLIVDHGLTPPQQEACAERYAPLLTAQGFICNITP
jgi:hypothetical protein